MGERGEPDEEMGGSVMTEEKELEMWREEWRALGGREGLVKDLAVQAERDARRIARAKVLEVLGAVVSSAIAVWFTIQSHGRPAAVVMCAGIFLFNGIWLTRLFTLRAEEESAAVDDFIALRRKRLELDVKWNGFSRRALLALAAAYAPWCLWMAYDGWDFYRAQPWRAVVGFGGMALIVPFIHLVLARKRRQLGQERERFETLVGERTLA